MFQQLLTSLKEILDLTPEKKSTLYALLFSGMIIWYLYSENQNLLLKIEENDKVYREFKSKSQSDCEEQLKNNREGQQKQLNEFYSKANYEADSINRYYRNQLLKINMKIKTEINKLKNEDIN